MRDAMVFCEIKKEGEYWIGRCLEADIFTEGKSREEALKNLEEAVSLHFEHTEPPKGIPERIARKMDEGMEIAFRV